jgi:hypothetical protein
VDPKTEGLRAAALSSQTASTKWLYQTVSVRGGGHYEASVDAHAGPGSESVFLRLSWYSSADGSGQAIDSVDSLEAATPQAGRFIRLSTGAVAAPSAAATVKVRLMLRPASDATAFAYFDSVSLVETSAVAQGSGIRRGSETISAARSVVRANAAAETVEEAHPGGATPVRLANNRPQKRDGIAPLTAGGGGGGVEWAILLAVGIAVAAVAIAGAYELWQRRRQTEAEIEEP